VQLGARIDVAPRRGDAPGRGRAALRLRGGLQALDEDRLPGHAPLNVRELFGRQVPALAWHFLVLARRPRIVHPMRQAQAMRAGPNSQNSTNLISTVLRVTSMSSCEGRRQPVAQGE